MREVIVAKILSRARSPRWRVGLDPVSAMNLYRHGYTLSVIAAHFSCSPVAVRKAIVHFPDYKRLAREQQAYGRGASVRRQRSPMTLEHIREAWQFFLDGHSVPQIAACFEVRADSVRYAFHRYYGTEYERLKPRGCEHDKHFPRELAWKLFNDGCTLNEVASQLGVTGAAVRRALMRIDGYQQIVADRTKVFDRVEAWSLYQRGWTTKRIGERFGYHAKSVQKALRREYEGYDRIAKHNRLKNLDLSPNRIGSK